MHGTHDDITHHHRTARSVSVAIERRAGVMPVVEVGGSVRPGDPIAVVLPPEPHIPLGPV